MDEVADGLNHAILDAVIHLDGEVMGRVGCQVGEGVNSAGVIKHGTATSKHGTHGGGGGPARPNRRPNLADRRGPLVAPPPS
jgi:hypothetical protein